MRTGECVCERAFERCAYMRPHARAHVYTSMRAFLEVYMQAHECLRQRMCLYVHNISLGRSPNHIEGDSWSHWLVLGHSVFKNIRFGRRND